MSDPATTGENGSIKVSDHSEYKDVESLIKGKAAADEHIGSLAEQLRVANAKLEEANKKLTEDKNLETLMEDLHKETIDPKEDSTKNTEGQPETKTADATTIEEAVKAQLARIATENEIKAVKAKLGDNYDAALEAAAKTVGITKEKLEGFATSEPAMYKALVAAQVKTPANNFITGASTMQGPSVDQDSTAFLIGERVNGSQSKEDLAAKLAASGASNKDMWAAYTLAHKNKLNK